MAKKGGREELIAQANAAVLRAHKDGISQRANQALEAPSVFVSSGSLALDRICSGVNPGGFPIGPTQGRVVHLAGEWSTGKTLVLDHAFKSTLDLGGLCLCSETEGSRDIHFATAIGLDLKLLEIQRPDTMEEMIDMGLTWHDEIRKRDEKIPLTWGVDSLDSSEAGRSADHGLSESGAWHYGGGKSEALAAGLRKIVKRTARFPTTVILLNQTRDVVGGPMFGPKKRTSGGNPPHFYASLEVMLSTSAKGIVRGASKRGSISADLCKKLGLPEKDKGSVQGRWVKARIAKTKIAPTFLAEVDFYIDFRKGVDRWGGLLASLATEGMIVPVPGGGVQHKTEDGIEEFESEAAWLTWLRKNLVLLEHPSYAEAATPHPVEADA